MNSERSTGNKLLEWVRRYLPCEIAGTAGELGGAAIAYLCTGSYAAAAVAATIGASVGYYAAAYTCAVRTTYRERGHLRRLHRLLASNAFALRSVAIEFGPAEVIDGLLIRPVAFYVGPALLGNMFAGWIFGKLVADVGFYALAILSYERFKGLLAVGRPRSEGVDDESVATLAVS
jgi:hypothetical protein